MCCIRPKKCVSTDLEWLSARKETYFNVAYISFSTVENAKYHLLFLCFTVAARYYNFRKKIVFHSFLARCIFSRHFRWYAQIPWTTTKCNCIGGSRCYIHMFSDQFGRSQSGVDQVGYQSDSSHTLPRHYQQWQSPGSIASNTLGECIPYISVL